jgi:DNA-binding NarL/FixJ family response regulator
MSISPIRILVVDDHPIVRHGLMALLSYEADFVVVGDAADGEAALHQVVALQPDVVLLDLRMPKLTGVEVMMRCRDLAKHTRFLVLTTYDSDDDIARALAAGAKGYMLKDTSAPELFAAIRQVMRGHAALEPSVAARVLARMHDHPDDELSARELEVLQRHCLCAQCLRKHREDPCESYFCEAPRPKSRRSGSGGAPTWPGYQFLQSITLHPLPVV